KSHIPSNISVEEQISRLRVSRPDLLVGYASCILEIARSIPTEDKLHIRPKFISVNSETSTQGERDFISSVFNCPVYDEYSTEETWMISSQCRNHNYHLFTDNVWVEFLDDKGDEVATGETGEIVLTTMRSRAMPFIRYRIGDLGRPSGRTCSCGSNFPLIESFEGRCGDSFILPSGKIILSMRILDVLDPIVEKNINLVEEYKVIQKEKGLIVIQIVKGKNYCEEPFKKVIEKLYEIFGEPVDIVVEPLEKIPSKGIKRKAIESWVKKEEVR
ncbi:MAG: hypothetical protein SVJ22_11155, partial [Halobacteriota archaeon]|nr:hypothetical protein [Halobacteriota archaeon]